MPVIQMRDNQLQVLRKVGNQVVTASKTFTLIQLVYQAIPSTDYTMRQRRGLFDVNNASCWLNGKQSNTTEEEDPHGKKFLWALRSLVASRDLLSFLLHHESLGLSVPHQYKHFFDKLTKEDVACAFSLIDNDDGLLLIDILDPDFTNDMERHSLNLTTDTVGTLTAKVKEFSAQVELQLRNLELSWHDSFYIFTHTRSSRLPHKEDFYVLKLLIYMYSGINIMNDTQTNSACELVCPKMKGENIYPKGLRKLCCPGITSVYKALERILGYRALIRTLTKLPTNQMQVLKMTVVEHYLGRFLGVVRGDKGLEMILQVAVLCEVSPGNQSNQREVLEMLVAYQRELQGYDNPFRRTKRDAASLRKSFFEVFLHTL